jgi:imidazolonepropionase-like amidohydrolase
MLRHGRSRLYVLILALLVLLGVFNAAPASAQAAQAAESGGPYTTLVIRDVTVIDGTGAPAQGPFDVVVKGNVITDLIPVDPIMGAANKQRATGDRVIEGKGMYVIPGLVDAHVHLQDPPGVPLDYIYKLFLAHGVTTVRAFNIGARTPQEMVTEQKRIADHQVLGPRVYVYPFWAGMGSQNQFKDPRFYDAKGAAEIVREWKAMGVQGVKITGKPGEYPDVLKSICATARQLGMGVAVHIGQDAVYPMDAVQVAEAGCTTIEHHYGYANAAFSDTTIQPLPADYNYLSEPDRFFETGHVWLQTDLKKLHEWEIPKLLEISQRTGFIMVPTFVVYEANRDASRVMTLPWHEDFSMPALRKRWLPNPASHASFFYHWTSMNEAVWAQMFARWMDFVNDYKNHGGQVAVGADSSPLYDLWGFGAIRELELLEQAGFTPLETIHAATQNGARVVGNDRLGVIRPGYIADMVVLAANPLEDMKVFYGTGITRTSPTGQAEHIGGVKYTIHDGIVTDSQALLRDIKAMVQQAKNAQAAQQVQPPAAKTVPAER